MADISLTPYSLEHDCDPDRGVFISVIHKDRKRWSSGKSAEAPRTSVRWTWIDYNGFDHIAWTTTAEGSFHENLADKASGERGEASPDQ